MLTLTETLAIFAQAGQYWFRVSANGCVLLDSARGLAALRRFAFLLMSFARVIAAAKIQGTSLADLESSECPCLVVLLRSDHPSGTHSRRNKTVCSPRKAALAYCLHRGLARFGRRIPENRGRPAVTISPSTRFKNTISTTASAGAIMRNMAVTLNIVR